MPASAVLRSLENVDLQRGSHEKSTKRIDRLAGKVSGAPAPLRSGRYPLVTPPRLEDDAASSVCPSELSVTSRLSGLSRRSHSKLVPSTAELDRMYMERKQEEVRKMRRQNEISARKAIHYPDVPRANVRGVCSSSATVPQEFALSAPSTPRRGTSVASDDGHASEASDRESEWSASLRSRSARGSSAAGRRPHLQGPASLTVPCAPRLRTSCRSRSVSRDCRGPGSCGARSREASFDGTSDLGAPEWKASLRDAAPLTPDRRSLSRGSLSQPPARWVTPGVASLAAMTPRSSAVTKADEEDWAAQCSTSGHGSSVEYFELSIPSRISRLARPQSAARLRAPSTDDLEVMAAERKKREVREQRRRNDENFRHAVTCPDRPFLHSSLDATMPLEFPLSGLGAEPRQVTGPPEEKEGGHHWPGSLRRSPSSDRALSTEALLPPGARLRLTMPIGPVLRTGRRSVSGSPGRSRLATPVGTPRVRSASRSRVATLPPQDAAANASPPEESRSSPVKAEARASGRPLTAQERAEHARQAAKANLSAEHARQAAEKAKLCIFKPKSWSGAAPVTSGGTPGVSSGASNSAPVRTRARSTTWSAAWSGGVPPSVGSGTVKERPRLGT